jgi:hypothetical protein
MRTHATRFVTVLVPVARLSTILALGIAGCSSNSFAPMGSVPSASGPQSHFKNGHFIPVWSEYASVIPVELRPGGFAATIHEISARPDRMRNKGGIYASQEDATSILGYANPNPKNNPPICSIGGVFPINDIAVDPRGYLIDPDGGIAHHHRVQRAGHVRFQRRLGGRPLRPAFGCG